MRSGNLNLYRFSKGEFNLPTDHVEEVGRCGGVANEPVRFMQLLNIELLIQFLQAIGILNISVKRVDGKILILIVLTIGQEKAALLSKAALRELANRR